VDDRFNLSNVTPSFPHHFSSFSLFCVQCDMELVSVFRRSFSDQFEINYFADMSFDKFPK
jgi:hypothetical protein